MLSPVTSRPFGSTRLESHQSLSRQLRTISPMYAEPRRVFPRDARASTYSGGPTFLFLWAYDKPNCPLGRFWLWPTQALDSWRRDRRAVGPDRWRAAGLLRQRQPNG